MIRSLRRKFVIINMTIVTVMLLAIFGTVFHFTRGSLRDQSVQFMDSVLSTPAAAARPVYPGRAADRNSEEVQLPYFYVAVNAFGEITLVKGGYFDLSDAEQLQEILRLALQSGEDTGFLPQYKLRFARRTTPYGQALVFVDTSSERAMLQGLLRTCVGIGLLSLGLFFGLSMLLARWAVGPVEKAWEEQRRFVADASHELKTPLTVITTSAELLADPEHGEAQRERSAENILTMARQMRALVERLLELARVDNGAAKLERKRLDLGELTEDALLPFEPVYFERELRLESETGEGLFVNGSVSHLKQVVDILLDNAAKYSSPQGTVRVVLRRQGSHALLSVASPGEEISREDLKKIFQRFYRVDKARTGGGSYGLGLAIAQSIVSEHGGKIWAESGGGVNTFFVQLPLTP